MSIALIFVQQLLLRIAGLRFELLHFRINVTVANQNVRPAIVVHIEKSAAPAEKLRVPPESGGESRILERSAADVVIERRGVSRKIGFDDVQVSVQIVIGR